jgi:hypothetical protein
LPSLRLSMILIVAEHPQSPVRAGAFDYWRWLNS